TSRRLGPMPPPARPPWHPEQLKRTNSWRPSPIAVRSFAYGFWGPPDGVGGPGIGPMGVTLGGGAAVAPPCGGGPLHAARITKTAIAAAALTLIEAVLHTSAGSAAC